MKLYLASPYSHPSKLIEMERFAIAADAAGYLIKQGHLVISPISHSHPIFVQHPDIGGQFESWRALDEWLIDCCDAVLVLCIAGWMESKGIKGEVEYAESQGKPVYYASMSDIMEGKNLF